MNGNRAEMDIRVAIFEDNNLVRDAMKEILNESPGFVCTGSFPNGEDWESDIRNSAPHSQGTYILRAFTRDQTFSLKLAHAEPSQN